MDGNLYTYIFIFYAPRAEHWGPSPPPPAMVSDHDNSPPPVTASLLLRAHVFHCLHRFGLPQPFSKLTPFSIAYFGQVMVAISFRYLS